MRLDNGTLSDNYVSPSLRVDQAVARLVRNTQSIPNTPTLLDCGDLITPGMAIFVNLSETDTDYVEVGNYVGGTFYPFLKVAYLDQQCCRVGIPCAQLYAQSNNAGGVMFYYIIYNA